MTKKAAVIALCVMLSAGTAHADMFGASDSVIIMKLTSIYTALKEYYDSNVQVLAQAKIQSDNLKKLSAWSKELQREYEFVKNFSLEREIENIKDDLDALSNLDNLDGRSPEDQLRMIRNDIDRRFKTSSSKEERERHKHLKSHVETIERLNKIQQAKAEEAKKHATEEQNEKTSMASIASSCALISSLQLSQEQRRAEEVLAEDIQKHEFEKLNADFKKALKNLR